VADNQRPVPEGTVFFPQYLQKAGYETAFVGKWHMGHDHDEPRGGFDHWVSFRGQGDYFDPTLNVDGRRSTQSGYTTDVLTDYALRWLKKERSRPFFLYLSHTMPHTPLHISSKFKGKSFCGKPCSLPIPRLYLGGLQDVPLRNAR